MSRIAADLLFPDWAHVRGCRCVACGTKRHPDSCPCFWCDQRRYWEADYLKRQQQAARRPVLTDRAAKHVAELGLTRRQLAARLHCSLTTAVKASKPGNFVSADLERRLLELSDREK